MATKIKSIVRFVDVAPSATVLLPHGLHIGNLPVVPDILLPSVGGFSVALMGSDVVVTNDGPAEASIDVLAEHWHTIERDFGDVADLDLVPQPFIPEFGGTSGSAVASSCFVYQPGGGGVGPVVFEEWADLYAALQAARAAGAPDPGGCFTIDFDNSFTSPTVVPAGAWNMDSVDWKGLLSDRNPGSSRVDVILAAGALVPSLRHIEAVRVVSVGITPISLINGYSFSCINAELSSQGEPFFEGSALVNLDRVFFFVDDTSVFGDGEEAVLSIPVEGSEVFFNIDGGGLVNQNALDFAVGTSLEARYLAVSAKIHDDQPTFLGGLVVNLPSTWRYRNNGRNIGPIAVDAEVGDIVRCDPSAGVVTVNLPPITKFNDGQTVAVCNSVDDTTNNVAVTPDLADTIRNTAGAFALTRPFESLVLVADFQNLNWDIVSCCDGPVPSP